MNPVEGLYGAFPFFLYINATYGGWLLNPILEFANTSMWGLPYAPRDIGESKAVCPPLFERADEVDDGCLGNNYPNATGSTDAHNQGVERECYASLHPGS